MNKVEKCIEYILSINEGLKISKFPTGLSKTKCSNFDYATYPDYFKLIKFINVAERFEDYFERVNGCLDEYLLFNASKSHYVIKHSFNDLNQLLSKITKAYKQLFIFCDLPEENVPKLELHSFDEVVTDYYPGEFLEPTNNLVEKVKALSNKVVKFINQYSIYSNEYRELVSYKETPDKKILTDLNSCLLKINNLLTKEFTYDFFDSNCLDIENSAKAISQSLLVLSQIKKKNESRYYYPFNGFRYEDYKVLMKDVLHSLFMFADRYINKEYLESLGENKLEEIVSLIRKNRKLFSVNKYSTINDKSTETKLNQMIGLSSIKETVQKLKAYCKANKDSDSLNMHMCFLGNPGTGKTEVARLIGKILYENGILPTNKFVEADRSTLVSQYLGETPHTTMAAVNSAMGGVLFIDEAYSLIPKDSPFDYGHQAVSTLIKAMEDYRGKICIILAGYKNEMEDMLSSNPGFKSRIQFTLDFPNYSRTELEEICDYMLFGTDYSIESDAMDYLLDVTDTLRKNPHFGNAREVRNIIDQSIMLLNLRNPKSKEISVLDIEKYVKDSNLSVSRNKYNKILTADEELDELIGLSAIKQTLKKIKAYVKHNSSKDLNIHFCFYGNPGTGKTEVARILSSILNEVGVLKERKLVETNSNGLISKFVGETGEKTEAIVKKALGGVLFIDEAYALYNNGSHASYGDEAISTLLKMMEDYRGQFCTVMAGYKNETEAMLLSNPGLKSRIQFVLEFPDYSNDELRQIAVKMLSKNGYSIKDDALECVVDVVNSMRSDPAFANARTMRNVIDQIILNQNLRIDEENTFNSNELLLCDVKRYIEENNIKIPGLIIKENKNILNSYVDKYSTFDTSIIDNDYLECAVISISGGSGQGTGFIVSPDGHCLTCAHCIEDDGSNQKARIIFNTGRKKIKFYSKFSVINVDEKHDIALIKLLDEENEYDYLPLADNSHKYNSLDEILMAGFPFGGETYTSISITDGKVASLNNFKDIKVVFANMFGKPGNSGSPVLDKSSMKVIGVFWGGIAEGNEMIPCFTPIEELLKM